MKKALIVSTILGFQAAFERSDIQLLQSMGYEVHSATNNHYGNQENFKKYEKLGVIRHYIPFTRSPFTKTNIKAYKELKKLINGEQFDLIHCHTPVGGVLGRMAGHACKVPYVIYTAHGFHFFKGAPAKLWMMFYPVEKFMSRYCDVLITINQEDYDLASKKFRAKSVKRIHGVGIDIDSFVQNTIDRNGKRKELGLVDDDIMLLSVGELDKDKNHILVLEAMKELRGNYKYFIAGKGSLMESHYQFIESNKLSDNVTLLGFRHDVSELLQAADIFVFPSLFEGLSLALMEAVADKDPVACSKVRGNIDTVVTSESYFSSHSPQELAETVRKISNFSDAEKKKMVETNYQNLQQFRLSAVREEMRAIYKTADEEIRRKRS